MATPTSTVRTGSIPDANSDGRLQRSEWHSSADAFRWLDCNKDGVLSREEVVGEEAQQSDMLATLDNNRDNRVTIDEWQWSRRSFNQYDRNGDGALSRAELAAVDTGSTPIGTAGRTRVPLSSPRPSVGWTRVSTCVLAT